MKFNFEGPIARSLKVSKKPQICTSKYHEKSFKNQPQYFRPSKKLDNFHTS
jgi:hypothetical protein